MYKINIKVSELFLIDTKDKNKFSKEDTSIIFVHYNHKVDELINYVLLLEKASHKQSIVIMSSNYEALKKDFKSKFKTIKASGGLVKNEADEILFIYRRGFWDLPKGKIEKNEKKRHAAIREVEEETGVNGLTIKYKIGTSRHIYREKNDKIILKVSYWYMMTTHKQILTPQVEEDIEKAVWMTKAKFINNGYEIYPSLSGILNSVS